MIHGKRVNGLRVEEAAFSPDGRTILTCSSGDSTVRLWDRATRQPVGAPLDHHNLMLAGFSRDGRRVLAGDPVWDIATRRPIGNLFPGAAVAMALDRSGRTILAGYREAEVVLWAPAEGTPASAHRLSVVEDHSSLGPHDVGGSPGGPGAARFGGRLSPRPTLPLSGLGAARLGGRLDPRRPLSLTRTLGQMERTRRGKRIRNPIAGDIRGETDCVTYGGQQLRLLARSSDGKTALVVDGHDNKALLLDLARGRSVGQHMQHTDIIWDRAFSPDDRVVALVDNSGSARLWDAATGEPIRKEMLADRVAVQPSEGDAATGEPIQQAMTSRRAMLVSVDFSPDGGLLATKTGLGVVQLWDTLTCTPVGRAVQSEFRSNPYAVGFSDDGQSFGSYSSPRSAQKFTPWATPVPLGGEPRRVRLWVQVITGLKRDGQKLERSNAGEWYEHVRLLEKVGGRADDAGGRMR
jgi:WD40 repeat protein